MWIWASAALGRATTISNLATSELNIAELVDARVEKRADDRGRLVLRDDCWSLQLRTRFKIGSPEDRHIMKLARVRIKQRPPPARLWLVCFRRSRSGKLAFRRGAHCQHPA